MVNKRNIGSIKQRAFLLKISYVLHDKIICLETKKIYEIAAVAEKELQIPRGGVLACCCGKQNQTKKYHFMFLTQYQTQKGIFIPKEKKEREGHHVYCLETNKEYISSAEAGHLLNLDYHHIHSCCTRRSNSAKGYHFCFIEDKINFLSDPYYLHNKNKKTVYRYDIKTGNYIDSFISTVDAGQELGYGYKNNIPAACNGKQKTAYGYYWSYIKADNYKDIKND